jgi:hypothetical protein
MVAHRYFALKVNTERATAIMKIVIGATTMVFAVLVLGCVRAPASTCLSDANSLSAASRARYVKNDIVGATRLQYHASAGLQRCLEQTPRERTISSEQRLGEMWLITGQLERTEGDVKSAKGSLLRAKDIFSKLRRSGSLHGSMLDVVLLETRQVDDELKKL